LFDREAVRKQEYYFSKIRKKHPRKKGTFSPGIKRACAQAPCLCVHVPVYHRPNLTNKLKNPIIENLEETCHPIECFRDDIFAMPKPENQLAFELFCVLVSTSIESDGLLNTCERCFW